MGLLQRIKIEIEIEIGDVGGGNGGDDVFIIYGHGDSHERE